VKNGGFADPNYFESEFPFLYDDIQKITKNIRDISLGEGMSAIGPSR
jgi:hypothetical protein